MQGSKVLPWQKCFQTSLYVELLMYLGSVQKTSVEPVEHIIQVYLKMQYIHVALYTTRVLPLEQRQFTCVVHCFVLVFCAETPQFCSLQVPGSLTTTLRTTPAFLLKNKYPTTESGEKSAPNSALITFVFPNLEGRSGVGWSGIWHPPSFTATLRKYSEFPTFSSQSTEQELQHENFSDLQPYTTEKDD